MGARAAERGGELGAGATEGTEHWERGAGAVYAKLI